MFNWLLNLLGVNTPMNSFIPISGRITSYGYPGDSTPDSNSEAMEGAWDNTLVDGLSLAVSRDIEAAFRAAGIAPRAFVTLQFSDGTAVKLRWDDRTAASYNGRPLTGRFDIYGEYSPSRMVDKIVTGFQPA